MEIYKLKGVIKMSNEEKLTKGGINWLACIYDGHHLNPYKMGAFKN